MRKIVILGMFMAAFSCNIVAQTKRQAIKPTVTTELKKVETKENLPITNESKAMKNISDLEAFVELKSETKAALTKLFITKNKMLESVNGGSPERATIISQNIETKLKSLVDPATFEKIKSNELLFKQLVN